MRQQVKPEAGRPLCFFYIVQATAGETGGWAPAVFFFYIVQATAGETEGW
jgi:hypothetical protein